MNAAYILHGGRTAVTEVVLAEYDCPVCFIHAPGVQASREIHRHHVEVVSCDRYVNYYKSHAAVCRVASATAVVDATRRSV